MWRFRTNSASKQRDRISIDFHHFVVTHCIVNLLKAYNCAFVVYPYKTIDNIRFPSVLSLSLLSSSMLFKEVFLFRCWCRSIPVRFRFFLSMQHNTVWMLASQTIEAILRFELWMCFFCFTSFVRCNFLHYVWLA